ncbi:amidohydrolase family protein [Hymenobacter weizhouensis]|uniref:amidohydrolase family protein n=1 Tax=Hymenobacter sp. YIM 151500-1 TaxID=2987689 RepID=UPI002227F2A0|nr:amidohydrolase family protein [Hymenobacter sp. YIM 151500-1]UYZ64980.1 amidohydrolase family protein [Hymenobacter sp. YIM 151500-1]
MLHCYRRLGLGSGLLLSSAAALAQPGTYPRNGVSDQRPGLYAFTHATIYVDYQTRLPDATLVIRDGRVEAVGPRVQVPAGAVVQDLRGRIIYPSFVDLYASYGVPEVKAPERQGRRAGPQIESQKAGAYDWNQAIHPEANAAEQFRTHAEQADAYRRLGFGTVLTHQPDGIARGTAALVSLNTTRREAEVLLLDRAAAAFSFDKGTSTQDYPSSLMGSIALLRQTYLDADWNQRNPRREQNLSLRAFSEQRRLPAIFEVRDKQSALRADKLGDEFGVQYIIKGRGDEYQRLPDVQATKAPFILTLNFPDAYLVDDVYDAARVPLQDLKHWEMAPANAALLAKAGVPFALSAADLKDKKKFLPNLRKAAQHGLTEAQVLQALTATPAALVKAQDRVGALRPGMEANFLVCSGRLLADDNVLLDNWVQGERYPLNTLPTDYRGVYALQLTGQPEAKLLLAGKPEAPELRVALAPGDTVRGALTVSGELATIMFNPQDKTKGKNAAQQPKNEPSSTPQANTQQPQTTNQPGAVRLSGYYTAENRLFQGDGQLPEGALVKWTARRLEDASRAARRDSAKAPVPPQIGSLQYPFVAYGRPELPSQQTVLIKNATVWTSEAAGRLENTDVLLQNGKIRQVGRNLSLPAGGRTVDGTGKHLTPGIIDEHSHIAISEGVNEGTQAVTSEVSIGDVVDAEDVDIYRNLAGGVVAAQLLHGSANPIGGQSALVKLRWGMAPEQLKIQGAPGFIKFALGENVKQSNWGELNTVRFPQTRMGVEQVFVDAFTRAREYEREWQAWNKLSRARQKKAEAPRRDLELDALVEILNQRRFITCHSYVQSEINMLLGVADRMGFKVNTFTHILEGYKVADKMKAHGANASTFSDWWAYKNEVRDAIPYNAAIMHDAGLNVAINSDDAEMSRRLNQEAAKTVKYGGLSEEEALKLVTINPARMLHLDKNMGSIREGKDADVVLWSDNPLSIYARAERTFVDGRELFSLESDQQLRQQLQQERLRLVQKMLAAKKAGAPTQLPTARPNQHYHCDTVGEKKELDE